MSKYLRVPTKGSVEEYEAARTFIEDLEAEANAQGFAIFPPQKTEWGTVYFGRLKGQPIELILDRERNRNDDHSPVRAVNGELRLSIVRFLKETVLDYDG
jgi:hypothetical protein